MKKLFVFVLLSCAISVAIAARNIPKPKPTTTHLKLPAFSSVHVNGFVNVIITGTTSKGAKDTVVESRNPQWVSAKVRNRMLYLTALHAALPSRKAPTVKVRMYNLNKLDVYGRASVTGKNVKSDGLYLRADTTRNINLNGNLVVDRIRTYGPGSINIRWVKGNNLNVQVYAGNVKLAGNIDQLRVKLRNHAKLDAQYLRTNHVLIQAKGYSVAKVLPVQSLRAFATDYSNVYFYKTPLHISRYTSGSGNVLQLGRRK